MFVDALLGNLMVFAVGQLVAVGYLRSGRFWPGMAATVVLWSALDWWLVGRFVLAFDVQQQLPPVLLVQATTLVTTLAWCWARWRRRRGRATRTARYRDGMQQLLTGDVRTATVTFEALCWTDPWDASAWLALGDARRRAGELRRAGRAYRRAAAVDTGQRLADVLGHRRLLLDQLAKAPAVKVAAHQASSVAIAVPTPIERPADLARAKAE